MSALLDLLARTVGLVVVVRRVREEAVSLALDQGRSFARPSTVVRLLHHPEAREDVVAVDHEPGDPVPFGSTRDVCHCHLLGLWHADRVLVVLADEHDRQAVDRGDVQALVPVTLAGRTLAEPAADDAVLVPIFHGVGDPGRVWHLRRDR